MNAPWTTGARPLTDGPLPVVVYLPGVTGYMEMSSFQTAALAAAGFIVVTLNQPGNVAAARLPDGRVIEGMGRDEAVRLIAPSYRALPLSPTDAARLAPEQSIIPYLAADIPVVIDRLSVINADPQHLLHGMLDLQQVGIMGVSLGAIEAAQACHSYARVKAFAIPPYGSAALPLISVPSALPPAAGLSSRSQRRPIVSRALFPTVAMPALFFYPDSSTSISPICRRSSPSSDGLAWLVR